MVFALKYTSKFRLNDTHHITSNQKHSTKFPHGSVGEKKKTLKNKPELQRCHTLLNKKVKERFNIKIFFPFHRMNNKQKFTSWSNH